MAVKHSAGIALANSEVICALRQFLARPLVAR